MFGFRSRKVLINTIEILEDENKDYKSRLKTAEHNNLILLENAEELRKEIKVKEDIITSLLEDIEALKEESFKNAKKPRKKAIKKED